MSDLSFMSARRFRTAAMPAARVACMVSALALGACKTTINTDPAPPGPSVEIEDLAIKSAARKDYISAAAYWGALYEKDPWDSEAAVNYAEALRQIGSKDQALAVLQRAANAEPDNPAVLAEFGKTLAATNRPDQALVTLESAARKAPDDWTVHSAMGIALDQLGRHEEAQARYRDALALSPENPAVLSNLGLSHALDGNLKQADIVLRRAASMPDANAQVRQNLALVAGLRGDFDEAERLARADLPPHMAEANMAYLRDMLVQPALWKQLEAKDAAKN